MAQSSGRLGRTALKAVLAAPELFAKRRAGPRILIYHQIGASLGREMEVATDVFIQQVEHLQAEGQIVTLDEGLSRIGSPGDDRLFVLTFDDGYADMYANAFPLLAERGVPFTVYITTRPMMDPSTAPIGAWPLTWGQLGEMFDSGLATVGAHTHTHPDLRSLSADAVAAELDHSNALIRERLGIQPTHFAYPKGWWSESAEPEVRRRYSSAVLGEGPPIVPGTDRCRLHRVAVQKSDGMRFFRRKLATGMEFEEHLRRVVRRYEGPPATAS